ncbi:hypothetical protein FA15DRAFT_588046, partial [Coprinopsis marcescibilis]
HYGCVGIRVDDIRVQEDQVFTCPPCQANVPEKTSGACGRQSCSNNKRRPDEYFVSGVIGRKPRTKNTPGGGFEWLLKWDGYPVEKATWQIEEDMQEPMKLIEEFNISALEQALDLDDLTGTVLLDEAKPYWLPKVAHR